MAPYPDISPCTLALIHSRRPATSSSSSAAAVATGGSPLTTSMGERERDRERQMTAVRGREEDQIWPHLAVDHRIGMPDPRVAPRR
uniref:Uncharacterized protein n=1 Tax=Oryza sativa subsp. japonica TaxID=39947 RepID=Q2R4Y6_ORYSJ|nr:hypothetical protein LOC_Os11g26870 [Oryza sativa Japonica Group]